MTKQTFRYLRQLWLHCGILVLSVLIFADYADGQNSRPANTGKNETPAALLVGRWQSGEEIVDIRLNGTITINGEKFRYRVVGRAIRIFDDSGSMDFPFQIKGDTMIVQSEEETKTYTRLGGETKAAGGKTGAGLGRRSGVLPELVGKWCYISNVNGGGGNSRMSNRCFTLYENGTYEYYGETSSGGSYGSSASQESDSGRWSATSTKITAYSEKHGELVYNYEKRNHSKTGDPMIVLEGDAFVTAYQKESW